MVAAQGRHHGAAPAARRHDGAAHGVPHVHEGQRPRGVGADALPRRAARAPRPEAVTDAAPLLPGPAGPPQLPEDAAPLVGDRAHDAPGYQPAPPPAPAPPNTPPPPHHADTPH